MADMLELTNWFNLLNTQSKFGKHSGLRAYGINIKHQDHILNQMTEFVLKMRVCRKKVLLPFQKGILIVNLSLKQLLQYLKQTYTCDTFKPQYIINSTIVSRHIGQFFLKYSIYGSMTILYLYNYKLD